MTWVLQVLQENILSNKTPATRFAYLMPHYKVR